MNGFFPVQWSNEGIVYHPRPRARRDLYPDPLLTSDLNAIVLRWNERWSLSLLEPWPCAVLQWEGGELPLRPKSWLGYMGADPFAARIEALVAHIDAYAPKRLRDRAWLDVPEQPWERADRLPEPPSHEPVGDGAFRSGPVRRDEIAIAISSRPTAFESMLAWLASSPDRPWGAFPTQIRVSHAFFYALRRDASVWRLPLESLRLRRGGAEADAAYVFGRRTCVVLLHRPGCEVRALLDRCLEPPADEV